MMNLFKKKDAHEQRDRIIFYKKVFSGPEGKCVLFDILNRFHVLNSHGGDAFKEGQRSAALYILEQCKVNLEDFDKLLNGDFE